MRAFIILAAMVATIAAAAAPVTVTVDTDTPLTEVGPVPSAMVGFNLAVHTRPETVASAAATPPGANGVWEALRPINPGLIRQWINAPECGLHGLDLPRNAPDDEANFLAWLRDQLAPDSEHWAEFDRYLRGIAALGDDVQLMLNEPAPPVWLGPFRWQDRHAGQLIDLRSGEVVDYQRFVEWCGLESNRIGDIERFERLRDRFAVYVELLAAHVLADPVLSRHVTSITLGNEPDSGGEFAQNSVRWRMWVYGPEANRRFDAGEAIRPIDQGLLQQLYLAMYQGVRAADPDGHIALGGPDTSWAHNQYDRDGRYWYLDWFIDGVNGVAGIGRERIDLITWHNYGDDYDYAHAARQLHEVYGTPTYLTEYNATAGGHAMNFMQRGAQTVAHVVIGLSQTPGARGACFFKGSGGGFGLVLNRHGEIWRSGAYFALMLVRQHIVGGQPVTCRGATDQIEALAVRHDDGHIAALLCNLSDQTVSLELSMPGDRPLRIANIELPLASERNDYRNVTTDEIKPSLIPASVGNPLLTLAPHGVIFAVRAQ